jgi:hypothetical protein
VSTAREQSGESKASNVRIFYLTSRPLSLLHSTRKFLDSLEQDSYKLPAGPIFCHLGSLSEVLVTELWRRNTHEFKSDVITKQVLNPFQEAGRNPVSTQKLHHKGFITYLSTAPSFTITVASIFNSAES